MTDPWSRPANDRSPDGSPDPAAPGEPQHNPAYGVPPQGTPAYGAPPQGTPPHDLPPQGSQTQDLPEEAAPRRRRGLRDPLSLTLVVVIVFAVIASGLLGAELYARNRANKVVAQAVQCVVQDNATVSFGGGPFLWQYATKDFSGISIKTAGNQIRQAKGMQLNLDIDDIKLADNGTDKGTIGSLQATINWSADGIKQTVQSSIPVLGAVVSNVTPNPSDGTILIQSALASVTAKPTVVNGGLSLEVVNFTGLFGITLPKESVQPALDVFTSTLTQNYPLGIKADSVQVTQSGVVSQFSTHNASIPQGGQDPCFAGI